MRTLIVKNKYAIRKNNYWVKCLVFISFIFSVTNAYAGQTVNEILNEYYPILSIMRLSSVEVLWLITVHQMAKAYFIKTVTVLKLIDN